MERARIPHLVAGERHPDWQRLYESTPAEAMPWHYDGLDPDFRSELQETPFEMKTALDIGCGLGNQAAALTALGFKATGCDISVAAVRRAQRLYPQTEFIVDSATQTTLNRQFDLVLDRGCFHVLDVHSYNAYRNTLKLLLGPKGLFLLKVLSQENGSPPFGPLRFSKEGIRAVFEPGFKIIKLQKTLFQGSTPNSPAAWLAVMRIEDNHA